MATQGLLQLWVATCLRIQVCWWQTLIPDTLAWDTDSTVCSVTNLKIIQILQISITFQGKTRLCGLMFKEGWGLSEEQKRRTPPASVIGLPRLSFLRDQSHRSCLLPNCWTNQLSYHPLISRLYLSVGKTICMETPVVVAEQHVWYVCVMGGGD